MVKGNFGEIFIIYSLSIAGYSYSTSKYLKLLKAHSFIMYIFGKTMLLRCFGSKTDNSYVLRAPPLIMEGGAGGGFTPGNLKKYDFEITVGQKGPYSTQWAKV